MVGDVVLVVVVLVVLVLVVVLDVVVLVVVVGSATGGAASASRAGLLVAPADDTDDAHEVSVRSAINDIGAVSRATVPVWRIGAVRPRRLGR